MNFRRRSLRLVALAVVVALPLLGASGVASAKAAKGCHKTHTCRSAGGTGTGTGGTGAADPTITVQIDPNPLVETSQSDLNAVIQVETSPSFAGDPVVISSSQLIASCSVIFFNTEQGVPGGDYNATNDAPITVTLDDDGNATIEANGNDCAPGSDVIEADLEVAPYYTALGTLIASPPVVTTSGVFGYPTYSGTVTTGEVETGDTTASGDSDVYAVFYVETSPVYAEQNVEISDNQLTDSCGEGSDFYDASVTGPTTETTLDDDGNAVFVFFGASCAATTSDVIADVLAGTHPTYTSTFTVVAPAPTI
jgi:hypothetical protein